MQFVFDAEVAGGDAPALRRVDRPRRKHAAAARHLPGLQCADHPQWRGGSRARHGALGHADAAAVPRGQEGRSRRHQHPADDVVALAGLARTRASLPRALHQLRRERDPARWLAAAGLVRLRREPAAGLFRRHLGDLDLGAEGQGRAGVGRSLRVSDLGAERRGRRDPSQGDAGDPDRGSRWETWLDSTLVGGEGAAAAAAEWLAPHCAAGREGGFRETLPDTPARG